MTRSAPSKPGRLLWALAGLAGGAAALGFCVWAAIAAWNNADSANPDSQITGHGWAALIIAFVMVIVVGGGLMWLAFYSARKGYDDRVGGGEE
jgi:heme/copper-type cytochrome/quinol oxidase subunit 2